MPVQTTETTHVYFPDGCKVSIKESGAGVYTDIGAIGSDAVSSLTYDKSNYETANAGILDARIKNMMIDGSFTLINLVPDNLERLGNGLFTKTTVAASPNSSIPNQVIAAGWSLTERSNLDMEASSSDSTKLKMATEPVLTSVTLGTGTPEVLDAGVDYIVLEDSNSTSGWSIAFTDSITEASPEDYTVTIVYGTNTPVATTVLHIGTSTASLTVYAMKLTHTDDSSLVREVEIFSVETESGGFQFNFKSAAADGVEEMPIAFKGKIDTSLTDGRQLMTYSVNTGAA